MRRAIYFACCRKGKCLACHTPDRCLLGPRCAELRVRDVGADWRIVYRVDPDAVVILEVFSKKTRVTPKSVIDACIRRLKEYDGA